MEARGGSEEAQRKPEEARGTPLCEVRQKLRIPVCERMALRLVLSPTVFGYVSGNPFKNVVISIRFGPCILDLEIVAPRTL